MFPHRSVFYAGLVNSLDPVTRAARGALRAVDARVRPDLQPGWTGDDLPDQSGRTWLITGSTNGIGREAARSVAARGGRLVLPVRNVARGEQLLAELGGNGRVIECDLSDPASVAAAAALVDEPIDVLVDNAGAFATKLHRTAAGHEQMWQTNVIGPFAFTNLVLPQVRDAIVITGSDAHTSGRVDLADPDFSTRRFNAWAGYSQSKLATMQWANELDRRLRARGSHVRVQVGHPGWAATNLQRNQSDQRSEVLYRFVEAVSRVGAQSSDAGSWPILFAATQPLSGLSYVGPSGPMRGHPVVKRFSPRATDAAAGVRLWAYLVSETGTDLPEVN